MARVARGDERAFQLLSRRHLPAHARARPSHPRQLQRKQEDVAQEAFMRVWTYAPRWQPLGAVPDVAYARVSSISPRPQASRPLGRTLDAAGEVGRPDPSRRMKGREQMNVSAHAHCGD